MTEKRPRGQGDQPYLTLPQQWRERNPDHIPVRLRALFPKVEPKNLVEKAMGLLWPWGLRAYPGRLRLRAWLMGYDDPLIAYQVSRKLPAKSARHASARLRQLAVSIFDMANELDIYADGRGVSAADGSRLSKASRRDPEDGVNPPTP